MGPSEFLKTRGVSGDGLYALRAFRGPGRRGITDGPGDGIGNYGGCVVGGPFASDDSEAAVALGTELAQRGADALLFVEHRGVGMVLVDGRVPAPPFVPKMNDARGPRNNVKFTATGNARMSRGVPAGDLSKGPAALARSELLVGYGVSYWRFRARLGSESTPLVLE